MDFTSWNGKLLAFVQGRLSTPLDIIDAGKILDGKANGGGFLTGAVNRNLQELSNRATQRRKKIYEECGVISSEELSDPAFEKKLPFPFVFHTLPRRFKFSSNDGDEYWMYSGREIFAELLHNLREVRESYQKSGFWLYGTRGYGKSHLLSALVCYLTAGGERVVYIPDCRECVKDPVPYIRAAMLFAWGDDDQRESIMLLDTMELIYRYFQSAGSVIFVIDQLNALACSEVDSQELKERKGELEQWLVRYRTGHKCILSTSANFQTFLQTETTQASELRLHVYGGFTTKEMHHWWERNSNIILTGDQVRGGYTKNEVEDQTGCIPLFLNSCIVDGEVDLGVDVLHTVWKQVLSFICKIRLKENPRCWEQYCEYVNACIRRQQIPPGVPPELIDHRYFYERRSTLDNREEIGAYACGIARDAVVGQLREHGRNKFGDADFLKSLDEYIHNEAVTGFFIEENLLATISLNGLEIGRNISKPMNMVMFCGYPTFTPTEEPILYCPIKFNFRAIDGIIARFDFSNKSNGKKGKCCIFPLQITIAKSHADSESEFFRDWCHWIKGLDDYMVEVVFLWISTKKGWEKKVKKYPEYVSKGIHIRDVNRDTWERYDRALKSKSGRGQKNFMVVVPQKRALKKQGTRDEVVKDESASASQRVTKRRRIIKRVISGDGVEASDGKSKKVGRKRSSK